MTQTCSQYHLLRALCFMQDQSPRLPCYMYVPGVRYKRSGTIGANGSRGPRGPRGPEGTPEGRLGRSEGVGGVPRGPESEWLQVVLREKFLTVRNVHNY